MDDVKFEALVGRTLVEIKGAEPEHVEIMFSCADGARFRLYHRQDCCESVAVSEVVGDVADLIGSPILQAEEVSSSSTDDRGPFDADTMAALSRFAGSNGPSVNMIAPKPSEYSDSWTWTFYKLATIKGSVTIRWLGESNGYYSESVDFEEVE